jgi:hypothetical protein
MYASETQNPTPQPSALIRTSVHQLDLALDHPRLNGLTPSERQDAIAIIAQLMLEARGLATAATMENGDEHA